MLPQQGMPVPPTAEEKIVFSRHQSDSQWSFPLSLQLCHHSSRGVHCLSAYTQQSLRNWCSPFICAALSPDYHWDAAVNSICCNMQFQGDSAPKNTRILCRNCYICSLTNYGPMSPYQVPETNLELDTKFSPAPCQVTAKNQPAWGIPPITHLPGPVVSPHENHESIWAQPPQTFWHLDRFTTSNTWLWSLVYTRNPCLVQKRNQPSSPGIQLR